MPLELASLLRQKEPLRQFDFEVLLTLPGVDLTSITLAVETAFLPNMTNEEIELPFWNSRIWVAGKANYETGTMTIRDFVDPNTAAAVGIWYDRVYDHQNGGTIGLQVDYKAQGSFLVYSVGHDGGVPVRTYALEGVWPTSLNYGTVDYTANDIVKMELTVRYDAAYLE